MKKSLSLILAIAMVFSMFASVAFAGATVPADAGKYLQELKVIEGGEGGDLMVDANWKRQDVAVLLSRLLGVEAAAKATAKSHTFADVTNSFYDGYLSWAKANKYMEGNSDTSFGFGDEITNQQFAAVVLRALGVDTTGAENFAKTPDLAVAKGIVPAGTDFAAKAKRGDTYKAIVAALSVEVGTTGKTLGATLGLKDYIVADLVVAKAAATGVKKVTVSFSKAVADTTKASIVVKRDSFVVAGTWAWNEAKTEATLTTVVNLSAGDYTATVTGLEIAEGKNVATFTVAPERIEEIQINDNGFRASGTPTNVTVSYKAVNQYGENVTDTYNATNFAATSTRGTVAGGEASAKGTITINTVAIDVTSLTLTVVDRTFGKSATKAVTVRDSKLLDNITLQQPELPTGKTKLERTFTDVVIPYTAADQYGGEAALVAGTAAANGLTVISSDTTVVPVANVKVKTLNTKDKLVIEAFGALNGPKDITLTIIVNATGKSSKVTFTVYGASVAATPNLVAPSSNPGVGENPFKVELQVTDNFGNAMKAEDIAAIAASAITITTGNSTIFDVVGTVPVVDKDKAYININPKAVGTANLTVTINGTGKSTTVPVTVVAAKYPNALTLVPNYTKAANGGQITLKATFLDQYGQKIETSANQVYFTVTGDNGSFTGPAADSTVTNLVANGVTITANAWDKAIKVEAKLYKGDNTTDLLDTRSVDLSSIKSDATLTYEIEAVPTLYGKDTQVAHNSTHAKALTLVGKLSGEKVALPTGYATHYTTTNAVFGVDITNAKVWATYENPAKNATETGVVALWKGATKLAEVTVNASSAAPVATTLKFKDASLTVTSQNAANTLVAIKGKVELKDQYGVDIAPVGGTSGIWTTSDATKINFGTGGAADTITTNAAGKATVGFVTTNGLVATMELVIVTPL